MKNKLIACVLSLIMFVMIIPSVSFADVGGTDPGVDDPFVPITSESSTSTTSETSSETSSEPSSETSSETSTEPSSEVTIPSEITTSSQPVITSTTNNSSVNAKFTKFSATFASVNSVKLSWSKVTGATSYKIYRSVGKGRWIAYKTVKTTSYTDKNLSRGKTYRYKICALKSGKSLCYSKVVSVTVLSKSVGKVKSSVTKKYVKLDIKSTYGANGYEVKYSTNKSLKGAKKVTVKKPTVKLTKLKKKTNYYVSVSAYKVIKGKKVFSSSKKVSFKTK